MANVIQRSLLITRPSPLLFPLTPSCSSCISSSVSSCSSYRISGISQLGKQQTSGGVLWVPEFSLSLKGRRQPYVKVQAAIAVSEEKKWWDKNAHNMIDIHSTQDFLDALRDAGDKLVIVEFYGTWCGSCRALFPKLCKTAEEHPEIVFLKVNFDENKPMCKRLNVKVLPYFHFYRGAEGQLESFSCSLAKLQKLKDSITLHNTDRCSIGPPLGVGDLDLLGIADAKDKQAESVSR